MKKTNKQNFFWLLVAQDMSSFNSKVKAWKFSSIEEAKKFNDCLSDEWENRNLLLIDEIVDLRIK